VRWFRRRRKRVPEPVSAESEQVRRERARLAGLAAGEDVPTESDWDYYRGLARRGEAVPPGMPLSDEDREAWIVALDALDHLEPPENLA